MTATGYVSVGGGGGGGGVTSVDGETGVVVLTDDYAALAHLHTGTYSVTGHVHDDRYFTEAEVTASLSGKSDTTHLHTGTYAVTGHTHSTYVEGPASATDNAVTRYDGTTGKIVQTSLLTISDVGTLVLPGQATPALSAGGLAYNTTDECLSFRNNDSNVTMDIGQEIWLRARNQTGSTIGNAQAVYINGAHASGLPTIALAQANSEITSIAIGLTTQSIANNAVGHITTDGTVHTTDTSMWAAGDVLYLSPTTPGGLTNVRPTSPSIEYRIGVVTRSHATLGQIYVDPGVRRTGLGTANQLFGMNNAATGGEYKTIIGAGSVTVSGGPGAIIITGSSSASYPRMVNSLITSGNIDAQNTGGAWALLTGSPEISIPAAVNDRIIASWSGLYNPAGTFADFAVVSAAPAIIRYFGSKTSTPLVEGNPAMYPNPSTFIRPFRGPMITVQSGDLVSGSVRVRFAVKFDSSASRFYASTDFPMELFLENWGPAS